MRYFYQWINITTTQKLKNFTNLKLIASPTTGDIHIDKSYIKQKKIKFINLKMII